MDQHDRRPRKDGGSGRLLALNKFGRTNEVAVLVLIWVLSPSHTNRYNCSEDLALANCILDTAIVSVAVALHYQLLFVDVLRLHFWTIFLRKRDVEPTIFKISSFSDAQAEYVLAQQVLHVQIFEFGSTSLVHMTHSY